VACSVLDPGGLENVLGKLVTLEDGLAETVRWARKGR
jgi:hypothetical protein